jgi:hypothetical protein
MLTSRQRESGLDDAVQAITGVAKAGDDVADIVELLVQSGEYQRARYVQLVDQLL